MSRAVITKLFHTTLPFKGSKQKLDKVPIDKFTDNKILRRSEFMYHVEQIPLWRLVFGDEKPLKGGKVFNHWGCVDHVFGFLPINHNSRMAYDPSYHTIDMAAFKPNDWKQFYGNVKEAIPSNEP